MKRVSLISLIVVIFLSEAFARTADNNLTQVLAAQRKSQVRGIEYFLHFDLSKKSDEFKGRALLKIDLIHDKQALSIDFMIKRIDELKINNVVIKKFPKRKGSFEIPRKLLTRRMEVEVTYTGEFSKDSAGFKKAVDPEDNEEYLYTDFEPYYAHWLFPALNQPDFKSVYHVSVKAPKDWKVIHNELITKTEPLGELTVTTFHPTKPLSPYLFFLGAGPFVEWKDNFEKTPLHLYARKTMAQYVDAENIFKTTKLGLKFFNDYFDYSYPFSKYGQIFIPDFAWGGMENPGAVTLNERNIFRGPVPQSKYDDRDNLILHEMAHMWFGDLVTMEWWNDLWLNESFATYLASIAQERGLKTKGIWVDFFGTKAWGYWQDQLVTTHPIETNVPDIRTARGNFDGITYAKGASALKQLHFFVGEEGFKKGLRSYFKKYAFKNTIRKDFINAIAQASKKDLEQWTMKWLRTAGPNRVMVDFKCAKGKITEAFVNQNQSVSGALSPHRFRVGLYEEDDGELELEETLDVVYQAEFTPIPQMVGEDCPDFVLPNEDDQDYALFSLDPVSVKRANIGLVSLEDPLARSMLWNILGQMVRDSKLAPLAFFEMALKGLAVEKDDALLATLLGRHSSLRNIYALYLDKNQRAELAPRLEALIWKRMSEAKMSSSAQMSFFDFYVTMSQSVESQNQIFEMLSKNIPPKGIQLDQDRRWIMIMALATNGHGEAMKLIAAEEKKDNSTLGKRMALTARTAYPDVNSKKQKWNEFFSHKNLSYSDFSEAAGKIHHQNYPELSLPFVKKYFDHLLKFDWNSKDMYAEIYFEQLFPYELCSYEVQEMSAKYYKKAKNLSSLARRAWLEAHDELGRCVKVRNTK